MAEREKRRSVKQQIRDTKRLLSKEDLPETVRLTKERVLKCLITDLEERQQEARDRKRNKKYRMVKFFEKRKVLRRLKIQQKKLSTCTQVDKRRELLSSITQLRQEINYVVHFPSSEKYLALYPSTVSTDPQAISRKEQLLQHVSEMVDSGELSDASSHLLSPSLLTQLPSQPSERTLPNLAGTRLNTWPASVVKPPGRKRTSKYTAAIDEEPDGDESNRDLAIEDDFFLPDSAT